jgi:hypothetical protein
MNLRCFGGFRCRADDPPKPEYVRIESPSPSLAQVGLVFGDHGLARGAPLQTTILVSFTLETTLDKLFGLSYQLSKNGFGFGNQR